VNQVRPERVAGRPVTVDGKKIPPGRLAPQHTGRGFIASFGQGRVCKAPGCGTVLSRYNDRLVCAVHSARPAAVVDPAG
jgi:hypothetical protein